MKGFGGVVMGDEVGEMSLKNVVKLADESEDIVVEEGRDRHKRGGGVDIKRGGEQSVLGEDRQIHHSITLSKSTQETTKNIVKPLDKDKKEF